MVDPRVTPEAGVAGYERDHTQGPACAIAAGAGTIFRNYFAPVDGQEGQTADRQLDGLTDLGDALAVALGVRRSELWQMQNGYALPIEHSLSMIGTFLKGQPEDKLDRLRGLLRVGLQSDVEVTDVNTIPGPLVSQIYCSALPVAYSGIASGRWTDFASLVLEAAYEATLLAGVLNAARGGSKRVLLTRLGGGAFGNDDSWISAAILRALRLAKHHDLDVQMVIYGPATREMQNLLDDWKIHNSAAPTPMGLADGSSICDVTNKLHQIWHERFADAIQTLVKLGEYFGRGVRSAAIGEVSELLVASYIGAKQSKRNAKGHDIEIDGRKIEVKGRLVDRWGNKLQFNFRKHSESANEAFCLAWNWDQQNREPILVEAYWLTTNILNDAFGMQDRNIYFARTTLGRLRDLSRKKETGDST